MYIIIIIFQVWNVHGGTCEWTLDHNHVPVLCCDFSPDSTKLLTGDVEGSVKVHLHYEIKVNYCRLV